MRQLQLLLPGIRIWLDMVNLQDVTKLEESVGDSAVVVVFLSKGYFASGNCRQQAQPLMPLAGRHSVLRMCEGVRSMRPSSRASPSWR